LELSVTDFHTVEKGDSDHYRAALEGLPEGVREAFDRATVRQGLAEDDPIFGLALAVAQISGAINGPDAKKFSELLLRHSAALNGAKTSIAQTLESLQKLEADATARVVELEECMAEVRAAVDKDREDRKAAAQNQNRRAEQLEQACICLTRAQKRLSWGWLAVAAGVGFVLYPFIDRLLLAPFGL
jgi:hypothetical protein